MKDIKGEGKYNVVVIGAGTAGLVTAAGTAGLGGRVALIERHKMGGDCLNFGCVPSKALISSARLIQNIRESQKWGLRKQEPQYDFDDVFERMRARRAKIAPNDSQERFESLGVDVFRGEARFVSPHEVEVDGQKLRAKNFVIATGSRAVIPKIEGIDKVPYFTNETVFDELREKPESMIVLGGGPIGCELGQAMSRLGVKITIVQKGAQLLPREDRDVAEFMQQRFAAEGLGVRLKTTATRVSLQGGKVALEFRVKVLDTKNVEVVYNSEWLDALTPSEMVELMAKMTVARMLERNDFGLALQREPAHLPARISISAAPRVRLGRAEGRRRARRHRPALQPAGRPRPDAVVRQARADGDDDADPRRDGRALRKRRGRHHANRRQEDEQERRQLHRHPRRAALDVPQGDAGR